MKLEYIKKILLGVSYRIIYYWQRESHMIPSQYHKSCLFSYIYEFIEFGAIRRLNPERPKRI